MSERLLGSDIDPKATVQAQTDMTNTGGEYDLPEGFSLANFQPREVKNHEVSVFDGAKAFVSGGLRSLEGGAEIQDQALKVLNDKANADDGMMSSVASAVQNIPLVRAVTATTPYIKDTFDSAAKTVEDSLSDDAKAALHESLAWKEGDNWKVSTDPAIWGLQFSKSMGYMIPTLASALATGGASVTALLPNITNAMIRSGANATLAAKAAPLALSMLMKSPAVGVGMSTDLGSQGVDARRGVIDADHSQLMKSQHYQDAFIEIDSDPKYAHLSDGEKFALAKETVSNQASRATMTDPRNVAASAAATMLGDVPLANAVLKGFKHSTGGLRGALGGTAEGILREAPMEAVQEGIQQRVSNDVSNEYQGTDIDPNRGVAEAAVSGGLMGAAMGGGMGSIGGLRGKSQIESISDEPVPEMPIDTNAIDVSATSDLAPDNSTNTYPNDFENTPAQNRQQETNINEAAPELEIDNGVEAVLGDDASSDINPELATSIFNETETQNDLEIPAYLRQPVKQNETVISADEPLPETTNTDVVVSDSRPDVIYGHDKRATQDPTIYDKQVGEPQFEGGIPKNKLRQLKYLANRRDAKIPLALQPLKGSGRFTRPEYRSRLVSIADEATSLGNSKSINVQVDSISDAITKLGGVNRELAQADGIDPAAFKRNKLFPATKGRTFDELAEVLNEHGYRARDGGKLDANAVLDLVDGEVNNSERHFSHQSDVLTETDQGSALHDLVREYGTERVQTAISKALQGTRLGDRQAEIVNEAMDVIETGRIEQAGGIESRHAERDSRREVRIAKRKQQIEKTSSELGLPSWVTSNHFADIESEYNETVESVLDDAIRQATAINSTETEALIVRYETGKITTADLISHLGKLDYDDRQKLTSMEDAQSTTERKDPASIEERVSERETTSPSESETTRDRIDNKDIVDTREPESKITSINTLVPDTKEQQSVVENNDANTSDIQDVGEKIGGAKKDLWQSYSDSVKGDSVSDIQTLSLSKVWPHPNYEVMQSQGVPSEALSLFRSMRDSIRVKPRSQYKVARWSQSVHALRDVGMKLMDGTLSAEQAHAMIKQSTSREGHKIAGRAALYDAVGHANSLSNLSLTQGEYSLYQGKEFNPPKVIWTVERASGGGNSHWPRTIAFGDNQKQVIDKFKQQYAELIQQNKVQPKDVSFDIYTKRSEKGYFIGKKVGRTHVDLEGPLDSLSEARRILNDDNQRLAEKLAKEKNVPASRNDENQSRLGDDIRQGGDVTADDFSTAFGFRGVEFGNWVDQKQRQTMINEAYDALMDMTAVLGISPKAISLNGELGLAFGARGNGGRDAAKAHYESGKVVINLTKKRGAGSLGHEWWHALDNYFGKLDTNAKGSPSEAMMTSPSYRDRHDLLVRAQMRHAFKGVMDAINQGDLSKRSQQLDKTRSKDYWSTAIEMSARSFESYLIAKLADQSARNDFLANIVSEDAWESDAKENSSLTNSYPYPNKSESHVIRSSFDHLFNTIEEHEFDDGRVMLYSQQAITDINIQPQGMPLKQAELAVKSWLRQYNGGAGVSVKVVQTQIEAEQILGASFNDYKVNAFYDEVTASVVVVADNIANTKDLRQKLRHEILVHHGLRAVVGDTEYGCILKTIYSGLGSKHLKAMISELEKSYSRANLNNFVEEVLAHVAEKERNRFQQWYDRIVAAIARALRKVGLMSPSDITKSELHNIVQTLTDRIKSVKEWGPDSSPPSNSGHGHLSRTKFSRTSSKNNQPSLAFLDAVEKARARINGPASDVAAGGFDIPSENLKSTIARKLADKFQVLKELQRNIGEAGGSIHEDNDAYLAEELFHGKAENDLRLMKETFVKPLADKMAQYDISQTKLDEYLIARHAQERNGHIASINAQFPDGGSGMKNADAQSKLDEIRRSGKQKQYDELVHIVDAMIARQRDVLRDSGLESDEVIDTWQSHYKHYVPLKGIAKDESSLPRTGKGFSIGGKEAKNAMGRKSMAESPSSHAILDLTEKLVRARKNEVGNTLLKLVQDNPSADYWEVFTSDKPDTSSQIIERKNPDTGEKEKVVDDRPIPMAMMSDYYFPTKKDGKVYYIKLHDQRLMKAMKNIGPDNSNGIIRFMATFNRFLASVNTSYNPEFVVGNFARDIQTAFLNLSAEQTRDDGKIKGKNIAKQVIVDIKNAMPAVYASLNNKTSKTSKGREWQNYFNEFMEDGGKTGWFDMKDVDGQAKDIERMVAMASGSTKGKAYKVFDAVTGFIENTNGAIENAVRLSAYVNARKAGVSRKKSASLAKNMTVNFNRRGEVGTTLNAMYMFANASIQGSANFVRTMVSLNGDGKLKWQNMNKAQKVAVGIVAGSFALSFANRNVAGDDDDGENWYDKVPDYVKERNFVIMKSLAGGKQDGSYWSIPMPYGYNVFSVFGTSVESAINSDSISPVKAAGGLAMAVLSAFSPIGMSESKTVFGTILKNASPTIGKPFIELALNENFFGGQVYKENMPFGTPLPSSSMSKRGTAEHYKDLAKWLNQVSGGSEYRSGALDVSPDAMQYIVGYMGGAALRFADVKVTGLVDKVAGDNVEDSQVAFLSRISGRVMPYADQSKFYERRDELLQIKTESQVMFGTKRKDFLGTYGKKLRLLPMLKVTENQLKALRKRRNIIYALNIPSKDKDLRLKNIERQMKTVIDRFNRQYNIL
ncbi:LPD5 domain-containing protein [Photobacterium carnosum]|uniref:LPD5 domain-containing protein n=1 Tax=Photobacterium carnosum TaxID=2023717 RepID=UPI001E52BB30|nr:LPD38 domain-containing protein [Photobacterium carnosum]MCD9525543.1 hypothetical protein [Photobacterium carnosum]